MQVEAKFVCAEVVGPLRSGAYEIPEDSDISDLLKTCLAECPGQDRGNMEEMLIFLRNGKPAQPDTILAEGDKIDILLKVFGG